MWPILLRDELDLFNCDLNSSNSMRDDIGVPIIESLLLKRCLKQITGIAFFKGDLKSKQPLACLFDCGLSCSEFIDDCKSGEKEPLYMNFLLAVLNL